MLGNKTRPVIGKLVAGTWGSGKQMEFSDAATSPRSPLDIKIQSPRGLKIYNLGGVGLGIVAALDQKSGGDSGCDINKAVFVQSIARSNPIPVKPNNNTNYRCGRGYRGDLDEEMELDDDFEDYTFVTCHDGPNNKSCTRVYCEKNGDEYGRRRIGDDDRVGFDHRRSNKSHGRTLFDISPIRFGEDFAAYPASDFLSCCHLCQKKLHGKDIYMYRGEKAFCSTECRHRQILMDERKEQYCSSEASRSSEVSNSPYANGQIFSTGILAI